LLAIRLRVGTSVSFIEKTSGLCNAFLPRCCVTRLIPAAGTAIAVSLLFAAPAHAQGSAVLTGTIVDTATRKPLADVAVVATSPAMQGSQSVVTDKSGSYRIPNLPVGQYTLSLTGDGYQPYTRGSITLRVDTTTRVNAELVPVGIKPE
jgi:hypothetical protein